MHGWISQYRCWNDGCPKHGILKAASVSWHAVTFTSYCTVRPSLEQLTTCLNSYKRPVPSLASDNRPPCEQRTARPQGGQDCFGAASFPSILRFLVRFEPYFYHTSPDQQFVTIRLCSGPRYTLARRSPAIPHHSSQKCVNISFIPRISSSSSSDQRAWIRPVTLGRAQSGAADRRKRLHFGVCSFAQCNQTPANIKKRDRR